MSPRARRIVIPLAVGAVALGLVVLRITAPSGGPSTTKSAEVASVTPGEGLDPAYDESAETGGEGEGEPAPGRTRDQDEAPPSTIIEGVSGPLTGLRVVAPSDPGAPPLVATLGSLDASRHLMKIEFTATGAGITSITFADIWERAKAKHQAQAYHRAVAAGQIPKTSLPGDEWRYVLQTQQPFQWFDAGSGTWKSINVPLLGAHSVYINKTKVSLLDASWTQTEPGAFQVRIVDADDRPVVEITRRFVLGQAFDITIEQRVRNLTAQPLDVKWVQYGPTDLRIDRSRYMDRRRFRFGYRPDPVSFPDLIASSDNDLLLERDKVLKRPDKAKKKIDEARATTDPARIAKLRAESDEFLTLWPNQTSRDEQYDLSWFAATNRYFALAVHPVLDSKGIGSRSLTDVVSEIRADFSGAKPNRVIFTALYSPTRSVAAGEETAFDLGIYAGPLDRQILGKNEPFTSLKMQGLILYQMSAMCAICTFQWLTQGLLHFLSGVHWVIRDWGLAIILLVAVVRFMLHPLTKKAQVNMQRFGKSMSDLKPEIEKLQKRFGDDAKKMQQEQMRLMKERGVNPLQILGCLPMFLQTPIWIALYAMLYFAFELRHEPAFWGFFQLFGGWPFLADLSASDHFFWEFEQPFNFLMWNVTGINLLPVLMGVVFFIQQKYMSPPPSPSMTKEQLQQQKIMKVMMVVMFPVMLYSAPSGLTLYIFTSSLIGIIESKYIRRHITEKDLEAKAKPKSDPMDRFRGKKSKPKDPQSRAFAAAVERAKQKRKGPAKTFKKKKK